MVMVMVMVMMVMMMMLMYRSFYYITVENALLMLQELYIILLLLSLRVSNLV